MLQRLLAEIESGGTLEARVLAARLGTTSEMVAAMLAHLARLGKLQPLQACNAQGCKSCGMAGSCSTEKKRAQVWELTDAENQGLARVPRGNKPVI